MAAKKISQEELRQMMRERAAQQKKTLQRIESPLAKYDDKSNLWCVVCNVIVQSEALWTVHLLDKSHKKVRKRWITGLLFLIFVLSFQKIEDLKRLKQGTPVPNSGSKSTNGVKRSLDGDALRKSSSKFATISEFSKKEILIKQSKTEDKQPKTNDQPTLENGNTDATLAESIADPSLPQDFFDSGVRAPAVSNNQTKEQISASGKAEESEAGTLPQGFFDDPKLDAKSRKGPHARDPMDEQMEVFMREIAQESLVSEVILEEEIEQLQKEKDIDEVDEQINQWERVDRYQKKIEEIHKKRKAERAAAALNANQKDNEDSEDDDDDDDPESLNDMNFWRSKGVIP